MCEFVVANLNSFKLEFGISYFLYFNLLLLIEFVFFILFCAQLKLQLSWDPFRETKTNGQRKERKIYFI